MALTCSVCRSDLVEVLADRTRCLACGTYTDFHGNEAVGGAVWTSAIPASAQKEAAVVTAQLAVPSESPKKGKKT